MNLAGASRPYTESKVMELQRTRTDDLDIEVRRRPRMTVEGQ